MPVPIKGGKKKKRGGKIIREGYGDRVEQAILKRLEDTGKTMNVDVEQIRANYETEKPTEFTDSFIQENASCFEPSLFSIEGSDRSFLNMSKNREMEQNTSYIGADTDIPFAQYMQEEESKAKEKEIQQSIDSVHLMPRLVDRPTSTRTEAEAWNTARERLDASDKLTVSNNERFQSFASTTPAMHSEGRDTMLTTES